MKVRNRRVRSVLADLATSGYNPTSKLDDSGAHGVPIDLAALSQQITRLGQLALSRRPREEARLARALAALRQHAEGYESLAERVSRQGRLRPARPLEPLDLRGRLPPVPSAYTVIATDGSQIEPDRHGPVLCHLVNVGSALLRYGPTPWASLTSHPMLGFEEEDVYLAVGNREPVLVQDRLLALKRYIAETALLADIAVTVDCGAPVIGLQDGTLLLSAWGQGGETYVWQSLLRQFLGCLDRLRERGVLLATYVSRPRSSDVVAALRLATCPYREAACEENCGSSRSGEIPCGELAGVLDRAVYEALPLAPGERSALLASSWSTSVEHYGDHEIHFFYLNVGLELARVEVPKWVATDAASLDLVHAVVYDQCARGQGYPRALIEAHEKAVITGADRRAYEALIEQALVNCGLQPAPSEKQRSKRLRSL